MSSYFYKTRYETIPKSQPSQPTSYLDKEIDGEIQYWQKRVSQTETTSEAARDQINDIFELADVLHDVQEDSLQIAAKLYDDMVMASEGSTPPTMNSIAALSLQLNKLAMMNLAMKNNALKRSTQFLTLKKVRVAEEIEKTVAKKTHVQQILAEKKSHLEVMFAEAQRESESAIAEYRTNKISQVRRQALKLQFKNFKVLKEVTFSRSSHRDLLFHFQPILKMETFLSLGVLSINQFLENLIVLQKNLSELFNTRLPYLAELAIYLPSSDFFDSIKHKENQMIGIDEKDFDDPPDPIERRVSVEPTADENGNIERIIKLGAEIKLPLSSKTINSQRRASLKRTPEPTSDIPVFKERSISPSKTSGKSSSSKRFIIIPHRILNKPFKKVTIPEFLKFVLVVAKIVANFQFFFYSMTLERQTEEDDSVCSFEAILEKVYGLDKLFESKLSQLETDERNVIAETSPTDSEEENLDVVELKKLSDKVYKQLIKTGPRSKKSGINPPSILMDMNLSDLIANQAKMQLDDWDVVSKMF
ncbi:predicted protein [Scheffersomyces stipitis CBS 6054]|uniref:Uncharacterized protein n=1 Tax=Scheffersomyces stipitis (strain ATCC 58785 / CBS 6054 / NBRC 10063 / NRRL Y-11545) TaxID=322104 RepID=A3LY22_PICST|nr:predicted protein [Scheffersomyces stipitis CBS 6054]ABN67903.2 predicted protein [Scheffersomyces stipitis CBS 6054]